MAENEEATRAEVVIARKQKTGRGKMVGARQILVVDDDKALCGILAEQFAVDGEFTAVEAGSIAEADAQLGDRQSGFAAVILDIGLPDGDGGDYCAELRRRNVKVPIIMLTGSDEESDVVRSLDAGANDYVAKPFRLSELLARVRAQLRSFDGSEDAVFRIGPYYFRPSAKLLHDDVRNRRIRLTDKEVAILRLLYRRGTGAVTRDTLLREVWGYDSEVTTHTLQTHIYRLRQKVEIDPHHAHLVETCGGAYRLNIPDNARGGDVR